MSESARYPARAGSPPFHLGGLRQFVAGVGRFTRHGKTARIPTRRTRLAASQGQPGPFLCLFRGNGGSIDRLLVLINNLKYRPNDFSGAPCFSG